jgi:hypothetical protein
MREFNETRTVHDEYSSEFGKGFYDGLAHCFYEDAFVPLIMKCLAENRKDELKKAFAFIEKLFREGDEDVKDMAGVSVVEPIYYEPDFEKYKETIYSLCGELTRKDFELMDIDETE